MVTWPVPGRRRTRATASLRRPVDWTSGRGTVRYLGASWPASAGPGMVEREGLGLLSLVGVFGAGVHLQLLQHLAPERALREHAFDRVADGILGLAGAQVGVLLRLQAARLGPVPVELLGLGLARGEHDLGRGDDHDVIARVEVGGEHRLVLAPQ